MFYSKTVRKFVFQIWGWYLKKMLLVIFCLGTVPNGSISNSLDFFQLCLVLFYFQVTENVLIKFSLTLKTLTTSQADRLDRKTKNMALQVGHYYDRIR